MAVTETTKPSTPPARKDSDAPKSGVRLVAPPRVPRPNLAALKKVDGEDTYVDGELPPVQKSAPMRIAPMTVPPPPPSSISPTSSRPGRAAVRPRNERRRGTVAPSDRGAANSNAVAAQSFRPLVSTAVDWPIVKPVADDGPRSSRISSPTFGVAIDDGRKSLPAFVPPPGLLPPPPPAERDLSAMDLAFETVTTVDVEPAFDDVERSPDDLVAQARRTKLLGFVIGVVSALAALALYALLS